MSYVVASLLLEVLCHVDEEGDAEVVHADVAPVEPQQAGLCRQASMSLADAAWQLKQSVQQYG